MLVIRDAQMRAFQRAQDEEFVRWAALHLRRSCAAEVEALSDQELLKRARIGLMRARRAGFTEAPLVVEFLELMIRRAPNFDDHPAVVAALRRNVPREVLLLTLPSAVSQEDWTEVRQRRDDRVWEG